MTPRSRLLERLAVLAGCVVFPAGIEARYGILNHHSYLVQGLNLADPSLLARDWLVGTASPHPIFDYLAAALFRLQMGGVPFVAATLVTGFLFAGVLWQLVRAVSGEAHRLLVFLLLVGLLAITRTNDVMVSYIQTSEFQPSTLAGLLMLAAMMAFVRERYLLSGILHALSAVHVNYLVLGGPLFLLCHLLVGRDRLWQRLIRQLAPPTLVLLAFLPMILSAAAAADAAEARRILFDTRPQHYRPELWQFRQFLGWHVLALAAAWPLRLADRTERRLLALAATNFAMVMGATLLTTVVFVPAVSQLFVWRLAPFSTLLASLILLRRAVAGCFDAERRFDTAAAAVVVATTLLLAVSQWIAVAVGLGAVLSWSAHMVIDRLRPSAGARRRLLAGAGGIVFLVLAAIALRGGTWRMTPLPAEAAELFEWARTATDRDALFLTHPNLDAFRLHAQRAIVVDYKSHPMYASGILEWRRRLQRVAGVSDVTKRGDVGGGYDAMDAGRLAGLVSEFHPDYVVLRGRDASIPDAPLERVWGNSSYTVYRVR